MLENSEKPLLVDFYAAWCGPCQFMVPILNEVGESMKDKIQVVKIDTDKYKIQALPTFILFKDGDVCDHFEGALNAPQLMQRIESALKVKQYSWRAAFLVAWIIVLKLFVFKFQRSCSVEASSFSLHCICKEN